MMSTIERSKKARRWLSFGRGRANKVVATKERVFVVPDDGIELSQEPTVDVELALPSGPVDIDLVTIGSGDSTVEESVKVHSYYKSSWVDELDGLLAGILQRQNQDKDLASPSSSSRDPSSLSPTSLSHSLLDDILGPVNKPVGPSKNKKERSSTKAARRGRERSSFSDSRRRSSSTGSISRSISARSYARSLSPSTSRRGRSIFDDGRLCTCGPIVSELQAEANMEEDSTSFVRDFDEIGFEDTTQDLKSKEVSSRLRIYQELRKQPSLGRREKQEIIRENDPSLYLFDKEEANDWDADSANGHLAVYDIDSALSAAVLQCGTCETMKLQDMISKASCGTGKDDDAVPPLRSTKTEWSDSTDSSEDSGVKVWTEAPSPDTAGSTALSRKNAFLKRLYHITKQEKGGSYKTKQWIKSSPSEKKDYTDELKPGAKIMRVVKLDKQGLKSATEAEQKKRTTSSVIEDLVVHASAQTRGRKVIAAPVHQRRSKELKQRAALSDKASARKALGKGTESIRSITEMPSADNSVLTATWTEKTASLDSCSKSAPTNTTATCSQSTSTRKARGMSKWRRNEKYKQGRQKADSSSLVSSKRSLISSPQPQLQVVQPGLAATASFENIELAASPIVPTQSKKSDSGSSEELVVQCGRQVFAGEGFMFEEACVEDNAHVILNDERSVDEETATIGETTVGDDNSTLMSVHGQVKLLQQDILAFLENPKSSVQDLRKDITRVLSGS